MNTTTTIDLDRQPETTDEARAYLIAWHRENLTNAPFFTDYINQTLAGDFAYHLARWLARRSNAGEAAELPKQWHERTSSMDDKSCMAAMKAEIADLRAALATQQAAIAQQEPVATVNDRYSRNGYNDEIDALLPVGTKLYAAPVAQQSEAGAQDAARYRFLREHWVSFSAAPPLSNLHWKGDKLDAKVDAAILEGGAHG